MLTFTAIKSLSFFVQCYPPVQSYPTLRYSGMSGFSNSFHYISFLVFFTASMPSESDIPIHTFSSFTKSSLVHQYQSIRPTIFAILQQLMMDRLLKKFAQPIHPSTATALPSTPTNCSERKYVTPKPKPETRVWPFPNPKTRVYRRNPGLETLVYNQTPPTSPAAVAVNIFHTSMKTRKPSWHWQTRATQKDAKIVPIRRVSFHFIEFHFPKFQIANA